MALLLSSVPYLPVGGKAWSYRYLWVAFGTINLCAGDCDPGASFRQRSLRFAAQEPIPTGEHPNSLAAADLDGDGDIDLAGPGPAARIRSAGGRRARGGAGWASARSTTAR